MSFVFGNICQIMTRHLYFSIETRQNWDAITELTNSAYEELQFWLNHVDNLPYRNLFPLWRNPNRVIFSDASSFAGAGVLLQPRNRVAQFMFDDFDKKQSSSDRE